MAATDFLSAPVIVATGAGPRAAVIGCGHRGTKLVCNFADIEDAPADRKDMADELG